MEYAALNPLMYLPNLKKPLLYTAGILGGAAIGAGLGYFGSHELFNIAASTPQDFPPLVHLAGGAAQVTQDLGSAGIGALVCAIASATTIRHMTR